MILSRKAVFLGSMCLFLLVVVLVIPVIPGSSTSVAIVPSSKGVSIGSSFTLDLCVFNVVDLYLWAVTVEWDSTIVEFQAYEEGPFLKAGGNTIIMDAGVSSGKVERLVCTILGPVPGVNGDGSLVIFTFMGRASGTTSINITFSDLLNSNGEHVLHSTYNGIILVLPPNTPPSAPHVNVTPDLPYTIDDMICTVVTPSLDPEEDPITYTYEWYKDQSLEQITVTANLTNILPSSLTSKGETWRCVVTPNDGKDTGPSGEDQVTVQNSPPTVPTVNVTHDFPYTTDDLICNVIVPSIDLDGDVVTYTYEWYKNEALQPAETTVTTALSDVVASNKTGKGETWKCVVTPNDGIVDGIFGGNQVTIQNSPPSTPIVDVIPESPVSTDNLTCVIVTPSNDVDGDLITYIYDWYKNDLWQFSGNIVLSSQTQKGEIWRCVVTPNDESLNGSSAQDQVTVQNSPPSAPIVDVDPDALDTTDDLTCTVTALSTDPDGDTITYRYEWFKNDVLQPVETTITTALSDSVLSSETKKDEVWKCVVTPNDGTANGPSDEDSVTVLNSPPVAYDIEITPFTAYETVDLVGSYVYWDADNDTESGTEIRWYKDNTFQLAYSYQLIVPASATTEGDVWYFTVRPKDGSDFGDLVESNRITIQELPPLEHNLTIQSSPLGVSFTVDGASRTAPWLGTYDEGTSVILEVSEAHFVGEAKYLWHQWNDGVTNRSRTVIVDTDVTFIAYFAGPYYESTVNSSPTTEIEFTIDGIPQTTPCVDWLREGSYTLEMPEFYQGYVWSHWLEDGDTSRTKTIVLSATATWTGVFVEAIERHETSIKGKPVVIETNITITNIVVTNNTLQFDVSGATGNTGWINVTFPMINTTEITVFTDGKKLTPPPFPIITINGTHYFIYCEFTLALVPEAVVLEVFDVTPPVANAGSDKTVNEDIVVIFDAGNSSDNVRIISYEWDFGDGATDTGSLTEHTYLNPGTYTVTLTVKDAAGNSDTHAITITVLSTIPWKWLAVVSVVTVILVGAGLILKRRKS